MQLLFKTNLINIGLEKMTKARDWMLFIPFLANYFIKTIDIVETILTEKSTYSAKKKASNQWEKVVLLLSHSCLDFIDFLHTKTVNQEPVDFPVRSLLLAHSF
jgi:hypothetical protein